MSKLSLNVLIVLTVTLFEISYGKYSNYAAMYCRLSLSYPLIQLDVEFHLLAQGFGSYLVIPHVVSMLVERNNFQGSIVAKE